MISDYYNPSSNLRQFVIRTSRRNLKFFYLLLLKQKLLQKSKWFLGLSPKMDRISTNTTFRSTLLGRQLPAYHGSQQFPNTMKFVDEMDP